MVAKLLLLFGERRLLSLITGSKELHGTNRKAEAQLSPSLAVLKVIHQGNCHSQSDPLHALSIGDRSLESLTMTPQQPFERYLIR